MTYRDVRTGLYTLYGIASIATIVLWIIRPSLGPEYTGYTGGYYYTSASYYTQTVELDKVLLAILILSCMALTLVVIQMCGTMKPGGLPEGITRGLISLALFSAAIAGWIRFAEAWPYLDSATSCNLIIALLSCAMSFKILHILLIFPDRHYRASRRAAAANTSAGNTTNTSAKPGVELSLEVDAEVTIETE